MKYLSNGTLVVVGVILGLVLAQGFEKSANADGGSVGGDSSHFVTSSPDGSLIYIWETKDTFGWANKKPITVWKVNYHDDTYRMKEISPEGASGDEKE